MTEARQPRRRRRSRQETEADLLAAARRLLERDGVLAGVNLREIAAEAGVNHGQIYQYFGSRQALLRAAAADLVERETAGQDGHWDRPFAERRRAMFERRLNSPDLVKLEALLALDGDEELSALPRFDRTRRSLERDQARGDLPADADPIAAHVMTGAAQIGYIVFREIYARDTGIPLDELDERAARVFDAMVAGIVDGAGAESGAGAGPDSAADGGDGGGSSA
ncbi:hypothetical protein B4N89_34945 [Embleya scabrispora]|uniref:HTH tetR-type domain-containing protein n=1 Tax=Embleya scabrispora TaxID=159449 RepID=A0A1T3NQU5_9ACTN|nr:TetR/AcrR family transcriptional regulator [Embleya scabrispora]OPC79257.1 hypothetical protein B4N89_34945 [Embleya scabrispora]